MRHSLKSRCTLCKVFHVLALIFLLPLPYHRYGACTAGYSASDVRNGRLCSRKVSSSVGTPEMAYSAMTSSCWRDCPAGNQSRPVMATVLLTLVRWWFTSVNLSVISAVLIREKCVTKMLKDHFPVSVFKLMCGACWDCWCVLWLTWKKAQWFRSDSVFGYLV